MLVTDLFSGHVDQLVSCMRLPVSMCLGNNFRMQ